VFRGEAPGRWSSFRRDDRGNASGRAVIVLDDLCASGSTLLRAASALRAAGAASVHAAVTHTPVEAGLVALLAAEDIAQVSPPTVSVARRTSTPLIEER